LGWFLILMSLLIVAGSIGLSLVRSHVVV